MKTFANKLEYRFLIESTKTDNAPFPYETVISEANIAKQNRVHTVQNEPYHKEQSFVSNYFIF